MKRLQASGVALLIMLDVVACTLWLAPLHVLGLADKPTGRQLISGYVGKALVNGHKWAKPVAAAIDAVFGENHCRDTHYRLGG